jgi:hypothetical protein
MLLVDTSSDDTIRSHVLSGQTKLKSASTITTAGKNVTIVKCQSLSAEQALGIKPVDVGSTLYPLTT